jgi:hypothetical protein
MAGWIRIAIVKILSKNQIFAEPIYCNEKRQFFHSESAY